MRKILFILVVGFCSPAKSQIADSNHVKLDLLRAPSSPASALLNFASTEIEKPSDVSSLMLSFSNASSSFTKLPSNYALDLAPYWLLGTKGNYTTDQLNNKRFADVFKQTLVISTAIRNPDSTERNLNASSAYTGLGFKFSLLRGEFDEQTKNTLDEIGRIQGRLNIITLDNLQKWRDSDLVMRTLLRKKDTIVTRLREEGLGMDQIRNARSYRQNEDKIEERTLVFASSQNYKKYFDSLKILAKDFTIVRTGWTWDIAGGASAEFINRRFNYSKLYNAGIWTTFGYTGKRGSSLLGLLRFLYNPDKIFALNNTTNKIGNISTFDAGGRYVYSKLASRFNLSLEAVYRSIVTSAGIDPSWRLVFNAEYSIWENQQLTFSFGRNFDGTITKDNNLIAALSFLTGFGNKR